MRARLTKSDLLDPVGAQFVAILAKIMADGKINLDEIKELRTFLRAHKDHQTIAGIHYLHNIMTRITADKIIDRDELRELAHAIYSVMPKKNLPTESKETPATATRDAKPPASKLFDPPTQTNCSLAKTIWGTEARLGRISGRLPHGKCQSGLYCTGRREATIARFHCHLAEGRTAFAH